MPERRKREPHTAGSPPVNFDELFANVCAALRREQRISYRALRRRFELSDDDLEDLKVELIEAKQLAVDEKDRILVWIGDAVPYSNRPRRKMAQGNTAITLSDIQRVVDQIVERFRPNKIWLFGSFAHGTPTSDSDVDLLVAMDTSLRNVQQAVEIRKAVDFPFPVDLLVRTPEQIAKRLALGDGFFHEVLTKGVVLHEATDARVESES